MDNPYPKKDYYKGGEKAKQMSNITEMVQIETKDILKRLMEVKNLTNTQLAKRSGLSRNQIRILAKGKVGFLACMRLSTIQALAKALDVPQQLFIKAPYKLEEENEYDDTIPNKK